ncbi:MAG: sigma 54-interacting transcriptional regulator [Myxococcaceae bacterium]|nr:sigma 54-interacting transcriptional regulator [Myxococcaceae bacterium]
MTQQSHPPTRSTQPLSASNLYRVDAQGHLVQRTYRLSVVSGQGTGKAMVLANPLTVGSGVEAGLLLADDSVSRLHVSLTPRADGVLVKDLGSLNGTFVAGARVEQAVVEHEATLTVGRTMLRVSMVDDELGAPLGPERLGDAVAHSEAMRRVFGLLEKLSGTEVPIVLWGETGTGKEVLAKAVHQASDRRDGPWVVVDCGAIAANLVESELFGHARGAFTGAVSERKGAFTKANGGTIFLDEIGELPLELQPRLLRVLESGQVKRVGDDTWRSVDVRVVAATHRDLEAQVRAGAFRQDLYYRLVVAQVRIPPLRDRAEDLPLLVQRFLAEQGKEKFELPQELRARMAAYSWPGNVRELRNVVARAVAGDTRALSGETSSANPGAMAKGELALGVPFKEAKEQLIDTFTKQYFEALLARHGGNISQAAKAAGIARPHMHTVVQKYGLRSSPGDDDER